jgi:hypothetical protein
MRIDRIIVNDGPIFNLDADVSESSSIGFAGRVGKTVFLKTVHRLWVNFIDRWERQHITSSGILLSGVPGIPHPLWLWEGPGSPPGVTDESQVVYLSRPPTATEASYGGMAEQVRWIDPLFQSGIHLTTGLTGADYEFLRRSALSCGLDYDPKSFTFKTTVGEPTVWVSSQNLPSTLVQAFRILGKVRCQARPGDVVLMDVPFDAQHLSEQRGLAAYVERIVCKELGGQLIITSNQPEILDRYHGPKLIQYILPN